MAVRNPVYVTSGGQIREMSTSDVENVQARARYLYSLNPSVTLDRVSDNGSLDAISDTRYKAGVANVSATSDPGAGSSADPTTTSISWDKIDQSSASVSQITNTDNISLPLYKDGSNDLRAMTIADFYDTFVFPAVSTLTVGSTGAQQGGTYFISTSTSVDGSTLVNANPVFRDTRIDQDAFTRTGIPETPDQPETITNYYLHRINGVETTIERPMLALSSGNIQRFGGTNFDNVLQNAIRYATTNETGYQITYNINGSGNNRGTGMANTILTDVTFTEYYYKANVNSYARQQFVTGTPSTADTYFLKINQV